MDEGFFDVGPVDHFPAGRARAVSVDHVRVAVFRLERGWFALQDSCPHMGASLADGRLEGGRVVCRWHGWSFDLASGEGDSQRRSCARVYEVRVEGDRVWVKPPKEETPSEDDEDNDWMRADPDTWFR